MLQRFLIFLLITFSCIILQASGEGFSESHKIELFNGQVVKVNEQLVHISIRNESVNLTSLDAGFVPCQLTLPKDFKVVFRRYKISGATALGNGKIVIWSHKFGDDGYNFTRWDLAVVDPVNCTSTSFIKLPKKSAILHRMNEIIPYHDSFDIFSQSNECSPCRYNDQGVPIDLAESIYKPLNLPPFKNFFTSEYIISALSKNATSGYLLTQSSGNNTSILKILSPTFEVLHTQSVEFPVRDVSTDNGQIRICSLHDCQEFSPNLRGENPLERITHDEFAFLSRVQNLQGGGAAVAYVYQKGCFDGDGEGSFGDIYIKRIHADGQVDSALKFETVPCWEYHFDHFQMRDGRYCLIAYEEINTANDYPQTVHIKCLKYDV